MPSNQSESQRRVSFWAALKPTAGASGVYYTSTGYPSCTTQILDMGVLEYIAHAWGSDSSYMVALSHTFNSIVGVHYDEPIGKKGSKGVLDFLIIPLFARKLIRDIELPGREDKMLQNILALIVALPLEMIRFSVGIALTLALAPVVALVHLIKNCLPEDQNDTGHYFAGG